MKIIKIVLCFTPELINDNVFEVIDVPPLALYLLASILENAGYNIDVIDPYYFYQFEKEKNLYDKCYDMIKSHLSEDDIICFSSNTFNWGFTRILVNKISEQFPNMPIILGGLHPSLFSQHILKTSGASIIIRGEGEETIIDVIRALENKTEFHNIKGITYKNGNKIIVNDDRPILSLQCIEKCALPDYSFVPKEANYNFIPVESSRGCQFSCAFCSIPHRHNWRGLSVDTVISRIEHASKYMDHFAKNVNIIFVDDCFTIDIERAKITFSQLSKKNFPFKYFIEVRATNVTNSRLFENIDPSIISYMQIGVECGYDEGLKKIKKGLTISQLYTALDILNTNGFSNLTFLSFIIGFPWEGKEEIDKTLDTIHNISDTYNILCNINWLIYLPSDLWNEQDMYNIKVDHSIYDDPLWIKDEALFKKVHPKITDEIMLHVEMRVKRMRLMGLRVNMNNLLFRNVINIINR